jgi:hypothetical protein
MRAAEWERQQCKIGKDIKNSSEHYTNTFMKKKKNNERDCH